MRLSVTLSSYIGRQYLLSFLSIFGIFVMLILLFDSIELLRRSANEPDMDLLIVFEMALLKLPHMSQQAFPFAVLFGGMAAFWRLTRSHELEITRAAGVSAWQFMIPVLALTFVLAVLKITVFNPLASVTLARFERLEATLIEDQNNALALSDAGLWLRQANSEGQSVVHADDIFQQGSEVRLTQVVVFVYEGEDVFKERIDARSASLEDGFWHLKHAWFHSPESIPRFEKEYWLETNLTVAKIQDSFAPPETMSFWDLPGFINTMEKAGFSAVRHRLHLHAMLASPVLACAMILIAATFTLRQTRRGGTMFIITGGVLTGFILYFFSDLVFALGISDSIPVVLAAWTPSGVSVLLGVTMLLHLEDG